MAKVIYLDYAAATPISEEVLKAMRPYFSDKFYNPSGLTLAAKEVRQAVELSRKKIATQLGARPQEIAFVAGGTESTNLAINGVMQAYPGKRLVVSAIEHEAVLKPAEQYKHSLVAVHSDGGVNLDSLEKAITSDTVLVSVMYANNEVGTIQPIKEISKLLQRIRKARNDKGNNLPLYFHSDACQAGAYLDLHVDSLGVDMLTLNGGKLYGPKQSGILYVKTGTVLQPQILGGGQENDRRSGTENVSACVGLAVALEIAQTSRNQVSKQQKQLQKLFISLLAEELPSANINGSIEHRLPNNVHITLPGFDNERLLMQLDERGIQCAVGSACSASNDEPSHVLKAIGLNDELARSSLRFSFGSSTKEADIRKTISALKVLTKTKQ